MMIIIIAIQDQVILTENYKKYILKQPDTDKLWRGCGKKSETIQHITAACQQLAPTEYVKRHDGLAKIIHQKLAEAAELIDDKSPYYKHTPANVLENENFKLYWNRSILTDKTIPFNWPDITFMNKKTKEHIFDRHSCPKHTLSRQNNNRQTKQVPRTGEWNMCYVEAKGSTSDPDSINIYGSNSKVNITESNKT